MSEEPPENDTETPDEHALIPDDVLAALDDVPEDDPVLTELGGTEGEKDARADAVEAWMPAEDEYHDETILSPKQARAMAVAYHYDRFYPEMDEMNEATRDIIPLLQKLTVSVYGVGREQQKDVLTSMWTHVEENGDDDGDGDHRAGGITRSNSNK